MADNKVTNGLELIKIWLKVEGQQQEREKRTDMRKSVFGDASFELSEAEIERRKEETARGERFWVVFTKTDFANVKDEYGSNNSPFIPNDMNYCYRINLDYPCIHKAYVNCCKFYNVPLLTGEKRREFESIVLDELARVGIDRRDFRESTRISMPVMDEPVTYIDPPDTSMPPWKRQGISEHEYHKRFSFEY